MDYEDFELQIGPRETASWELVCILSFSRVR